MLKCQREGWSCLSGSFLRKLNLPWFPAWVLHQLRSPFREQPVHSFCLRMTVVPPSSSHWDPTRPVAAALGAWVSCWPRERWSSYGWISIAQNVRAGRDHGEGEFPHSPEKAADAQARGAGREKEEEETNGPACSYPLFFSSPDLATSTSPQLEFLCWGQERGQWEGHGRTRNG